MGQSKIVTIGPVVILSDVPLPLPSSLLKLPINSEVTAHCIIIILLLINNFFASSYINIYTYWVVYYRNSNSSDELKTAITKILSWKLH